MLQQYATLNSGKPKMLGKNIKKTSKDAPKRIARRTRRGSSIKVAFGGKGVTIFPDLRSSRPA